VDENVAGATGCSIDKSVYLIKEIEKEFNVTLFDRFRIAFRDGERIINCGREAFEELIKTGTISQDTVVFNNMIQSRKELQTSWEIPIKNSWHAKVFHVS
jgi:hypothetical protein